MSEGTGDVENRLKGLQVKETELKISKLEKDNKFVEYQLSRRYTTLELIKVWGSIIAVFLTLPTIIISVYRWSEDNNMMRLSKREDQFSNTVVLFGEAAISKKIAGIISFKSFLHDDDTVKTDQIFQLLINSLAIEEDPALTSAILDFFNDAPFDKLNKRVLAQAVTTIVKLNRIAYREMGQYDYKPNKKNEKEKESTKARSLASCLSIFIKNGIIPKDLSNLYLDYSDFTGISFEEGTSFNKSNLSTSKFEHSSCKRCSFVDADLSGVSFIGTNLEGSNFKTDVAINLLLKNYLENHIELPALFDSTNLTRCDFSGFPILFASSKEDSSSLNVYSSFRGALLNDVNFKTSIMAGPISTWRSNQPKLPKIASVMVAVGKYGNFVNYRDSICLYTVNLDSLDLKTLNTLPHFENLSQEDLNTMVCNTFCGSMLFNPKFPPVLEVFIKSKTNKVSQ